ncbi:MAG: 23S rRNA (pseudouridine(1915)-N(3))-methyltransferase RlmH [Pseudomonadales bacterium]|nr:23S rRNA (pseudouridine(1915)-N(3))-methyltransferase RlmH [Pseudomonadales bacterium]
MVIRMLSIGTKMPSWMQQGYAEYARRLPKDNALELVELPLRKRGSDSIAVQQLHEEKRLLAKINQRDLVIALDESGQSWSSKDLAGQMNKWRNSGCNIALLVGGPDGLSEHCKKLASGSWSLSRATLPHGLVRVMIAEQIYRAWSLNNNRPYHRA